MKQICCAIVQFNATVGDLKANSRRIAEQAKAAAEQGAQVVIFPECALSGYPPEDLVLKPHFVRDCERSLAALSGVLPPAAVCLVGSPVRGDRAPHNAAVLFYGGRELARYHKMELPNYGVFDEIRIFTPGREPLVFEVNGLRLAVHICEDSWLPESRAIRELAPLQPDAILNLSASPYHSGKPGQRAAVLGATARTLSAHLLYANLCGGQDELVFDGVSKVMSPQGHVLARACSFDEDILFFNLQSSGDAGRGISGMVCLDVPPSVGTPEASRIEPLPEYPLDVLLALVTGLRDYVQKNGFESVVIGLSGGIDSALVAALAVDALGPECVIGVSMPSRFSSGETRGDAERLAGNLGIEFHTLAIQPLFEAYLRDLAPLGIGENVDTTEENLQARIRGNILMALSNKRGSMVLTTGNKSEMATGYCTLYGDMAGGFAVIKDVPKTLVFELCRLRNSLGTAPLIPPSIISRPPSAELREDQRDSDSLPAYEILDPILKAYVEAYASTDDIVAMGYPPDEVRRVVRLVDMNEYKRRQGPPGIKITPRAFGRDRRMPITNRYRDCAS